MGLGVFLAGCGGRTAITTLPGPVWSSRPDPAPPAPKPAPIPANPLGNVVARNQWAKDSPAVSLMNRMLPISYITVHHDGMDPFFATDSTSTAARLERIRKSHRSKGWGDIGYHFAVDRSGRVWEGRALSWQGAHVKDYNEGNIGIVTLGNFDRQSPSPQQLAALNALLTRLMKQYRVSLSHVRTHQEWPSATACPGTNLQRYMVAVRNNRQLG
jgi:N-acetyl-anhydromuramyl-L-alanine amidase AmpD